MPDDIDRLLDFRSARQTRATSNVINSFDDDPDKAARARDLGEDTGVPDSLVFSDYDNFERQHRTALTNSLLISDYELTNHFIDPMNAKISHDDIGALAQISKMMRRVALDIIPGGAFLNTPQGQEILSKTIEGFTEGFGPPQLGGWLLQRPQDIEFVEKHPWLANIAATAGGAVELPMKFFGGGIGAFHNFVEAAGSQLGLDPSTSKRLARELSAVAESELMRSAGPGTGGALEAQQRLSMIRKFNQHLDAHRLVEPYVQSGQPIPVGLSPYVDRVLIEHSKNGLIQLNQILSDVNKSVTKKRSPPTLEQFLSGIDDQVVVNLDPDKVAEIYKDKAPMPDDGLLGWIPDLENQMNTALGTKGSIEVALSKWLANVTPEIMEALKDHIGVGKGGLSKTEIEAVEKFIEAWHGSPHEFEAFDISKVGTGEGAQSYGYGLYFAEHPEVAKQYRSAGARATVQGRPFNPNEPLHYAAQLIDEYGAEGALKEAKARQQHDPGSFFDEVIRFIERGNVPKIEVPRQLYRVRIRADKDKFLDWDKPFEEQSPHVQAALEKVRGKYNPVEEGFTLGKDFYQEISTYHQPSPEEASEALRQAGIPGIKYLDRRSRFKPRTDERLERLQRNLEQFRKDAAETDDPEYKANLEKEAANVEKLIKEFEEPLTHNFVLFDSGLVEILTRNGEILNNVRKSAGLTPQLDVSGPPGKKPPEPPGAEKPGAPGQEPPPPPEMPIFSTIPGWITKPMMAKYQQLIDRQREANAGFIKAKADRVERQRQTREWKEESVKVREELRPQVENRPDIAALEYLSKGILYGQQVVKEVIDEKTLTLQQKLELPMGSWGKGGRPATEVARLFGYPTAQAMVDAIRGLRKQYGVKPIGTYKDLALKAEVDKVMKERFGDLEANILRETQEFVATDTTMDLLHEDTVGLGMQAKSAITFSKADWKRWAQIGLGEMLAKAASMEKLFRASGKAGRATELAWLKGDVSEAFKAKQAQGLAFQMAIEAKKFEKERGQNETLMGRYKGAANLPKVAQEYTDQVHQLMRQVGVELSRTNDNLDNSLKGVTFDEFRQKENAKGAGILDPNLPRKETGELKPLSDFTVDEYRDFAAALKSLDENGRAAKQIEVGTQMLETQDAIAGVVDGLTQLKKFDPKRPISFSGVRRVIRYADAMLVKVEQLADWIDHNDPRGWFNQTVVRPMFAAQSRRGDLIAKIAADFEQIPVDRAWGRALDDMVDNQILHEVDEQGNPTAEYKQISNEGKIAIALNFGNRSNRTVLTKGYGWTEQNVEDFLKTHMTKMDWAFVDGVWKIFDEHLGPIVEEATKKRSGVAIEMMRPEPVLGHSGGYYPLIEDHTSALYRDRKKIDLIDRPFSPFGLPMARALKLRTGAVYPLELSLSALASRINETVHASLFQDPIRNALKVTGDPKVRKGIAEAFGPEYVKSVDDWLKDIANNGGEEGGQGHWLSRNLRENVVYGLMGYRVSTAIIHGLSAGVSSFYEVGPMNLGRAYKDLGLKVYIPEVARRFFSSDEAMWKQIDWAQEKFPELRNRMRDIGRDMHAQVSGLISKGLLDDAAKIRAVNLVWSMKMVAFLDQFTATPTAIAAYKKALANGLSEADAVYAGEKAVRQAHGSASLVGRANVGRGEGMKWLTIAYNGYWNHNYNRTRSAVRDVFNQDLAISDRFIGGSAALFAFILAPAYIHWQVRGSPSESWQGATTEAILSQFGGQIPVMNTVTHSIFHNRDPHVSPFDDVLSRIWTAEKDITSPITGKRADHWLQHTDTLGFLTGLGPSSQISNMLQFNHDVFTQKERPKSIMEWAQGNLMAKTTLRKRRPR